MAKAGQIHHWKHGWIPLDDFARAQLAKKHPTLALRTAPATPKAVVPAFDDLSPSLQSKINAKLTSLTGIPEPQLAAKVQDNLIRLYKAGDLSEADWYPREGAEIADRAASIRKDFPSSKLTAEQLTGMVAATSAKKRWLENKDFAESIARTLAADQQFHVDQETIDNYNAWATKRRVGLAKPHPELEPGDYRPSELPSDFVASKTPGMKKHLNADAVINAVSLYRGEPMESVIKGPKQRSFIHNLTNPDDDRYVTVDTWHYRAAMQGIPLTKTVGPKGKQQTFNYTLEEWADRELSVHDGRAKARGYDGRSDRYSPKNLAATILAADGMSPQTFFQGGPSSVAEKYDGNTGTYPWFVKQTQLAADKLGVSPNAVQAVAWYSVGGGA